MAGMLEGKTALVTGGGAGIGKATAMLMAAEGARVVVADINAQSGEETARVIRSSGGEAVFTRADSGDEQEIAAMVSFAIRSYGALDCAFNNAGIFHSSVGASGPLHELTSDHFDGIVRVNMRGVFLCMKYELAHMESRGTGTIVNTSSIAGVRGLGGSALYTATKHAVVGLTRAAALEYAGRGVRVNAVCPGWTRTERFDESVGANSPWEAQMKNSTPLGRLGTTREIAEAVAWLCSERSSFVTGQAFAVDGGFTAGPSLSVFTGGARENLERLATNRAAGRQ